jgi:anti-anti-sigma regulatory factor
VRKLRWNGYLEPLRTRLRRGTVECVVEAGFWIERKRREVVLHGELDLGAAPAIEAWAADLPQYSPVLLDLAPLSFVDVAGAHALAAALRRVHPADVVLAGCRPSARFVLGLAEPVLFGRALSPWEGRALPAPSGPWRTTWDDQPRSMAG